ncbi:hypothetical protein WKH63_23535 [Pantoea agglomerans]|uniref:hypothetical protein n=1 Tax=Enterobacter agglomerans TaxID=549 RepID=UPI003C7E97B8
MSKRLKLISSFISESYRCGSCDVALTEAQVNETWKCPNPGCNDYVIIDATDTQGKSGTFIRKGADEINAGDVMRRNKEGVSDAVEVLAVRPGTGKNEGKIAISCAASGTIYAEPDRGYTFHI